MWSAFTAIGPPGWDPSGPAGETAIDLRSFLGLAKSRTGKKHGELFHYVCVTK